MNKHVVVEREAHSLPHSLVERLAWGDRDDVAEALGELRCMLADGDDYVPFPSTQPTHSGEVITDNSKALANALERVDRLKLEAQIHAGEARTANATIAEIYQIISGGKGELGNWHGAEPVRQRIAELEAFVSDCAQTAGGMVNGNRLSSQAKALLSRIQEAP